MRQDGEVHDAITSTYDYAEDEYVWPHVKEVRTRAVTADGPSAIYGLTTMMKGGETRRNEMKRGETRRNEAKPPILASRSCGR